MSGGASYNPERGVAVEPMRRAWSIHRDVLALRVPLGLMDRRARYCIDELLQRSVVALLDATAEGSGDGPPLPEASVPPGRQLSPRR